MNPIYQFTVPVFVKSLNALDALLGKVQTQLADKQVDEVTLMEVRLAPDMFPFTRQVQIACDNAKGSAARLAGLEIPSYPDTEMTITALRARITKTLDFLATVPERAFEAAAERQITLPYFPGKYMTGFDYAREYAVPNFLFHVVTAYAILRMKGFEIGKTDYTGGLPLKDLAT